jgi:hypothetical protein
MRERKSSSSLDRGDDSGVCCGVSDGTGVTVSVTVVDVALGAVSDAWSFLEHDDTSATLTTASRQRVRTTDITRPRVVGTRGRTERRC